MESVPEYHSRHTKDRGTGTERTGTLNEIVYTTLVSEQCDR